jgi:hypothetical protein
LACVEQPRKQPGSLASRNTCEMVISSGSWHTLRQFQEWNLKGGPRRINVADLTRKDLLEYRKWILDDEKHSARTAENKLTRISQWYRDSLKLTPGEGIITTKDT